MSKRLMLVIAAVFFFAAMGVPSAHAAPPGYDWQPLFNGHDLSGWKVPEGDGGHWKVVDGVIDYDAQSQAKKDKNLWTEREFGDFMLSVGWRIKETKGPKYNAPIILADGSLKKGPDGKPVTTPIDNADSGIFLRGYPRAQLNIWCWPAGSGEIWGYRTDAKMPPEVRAACVPKLRADKPVGQWNMFIITVQGDRVSVELNGQKVIDRAQLPGLPARGPIGLQHHGGLNLKTGQWAAASSLMQFREIYVKELK
jgi:hypothetical protein